MLELWTIVPSPTGQDPDRHTLWLRGQLADVQTIIRKFGSICGRPQKERSAPEYNFRLHLSSARPDVLDRMQTMLRGLAPAGPDPRGEKVQPSRPSFETPAPPPPPPPPPPAPFAEAPAPALQDLSAPPAPEAFIPPAPEPFSAPAAPADGPAAPPIDVAPSAPSAPLPAAPPAADEPAFGAPVALNPAFTFETLQVGSYNRFPHAASMSVVSSPGTMYNPLLLFGGPAVGKTHLLHAIGWSLQQQRPNDRLLLTTGPKLARAAARARRSGRLAELEALAKGSAALLIDDVHLLGVGEENQEPLAALLKAFFAAQKQVVMTSVYPPRALGGLEEALKFQISAGWSVDLKALTREVHRDLLGPALAAAGFEADETVLEGILGKLEGSFFDLSAWIERLKALADLRRSAKQPAALADLLGVLFAPEPAPATPASADEIEAAANALPAADGGDGLPLALFYPKGRQAYGRFVARQFNAVMQENRWPVRLAQVHEEEYDPEQLHGVPFAIGEACERRSARVALVLGPTPGSGLSGRESELAHAVDHLVHGLGLRMGWINFLRMRQPGPYVRAALDIFQAFKDPR